MVRRNEIFGISIVALLCLLLIAFSQKETTNYRRSPKYQQLIDLEESFRVSNNFTVPTPTIQDVISMQRNLLLSELHDYQFPEGDNLEDYTLFTGGQPVRTIIITTWRSGSTFLGDIINSLPGNYYHYEPLLEYGIMQIRGSPHAETALQTLRRLLNCDYTSLYSYLEYGMSHVYLFTHNTRLWNQCEMYPQYCWNYTFLNEMCRLFPFQSMKTVRLRLWLAESLLEDEEALRYEDLSLNPEEIVEDLFDFLGLYFHRDVKRFIDSHTRINVGGVSSTFRDSKNAPFHWRMDLNYTEVQYIEENCDEAMKLWGYVRSKNASSMREFNPLTDYDIK
nr:uncharacterized protein LOC111508365 [Leptinotarsa decemlineata]